MVKRHQAQVLRQAGVTQVDVGQTVGASERTVRRVEAEPPVGHLDDARERARRRVGRPSKAEGWRALVKELLEVEPALSTKELLRRVRLAGANVGKSAFYELVASQRPKDVRPLVRFEGLPGEFSQHDFGEVDVRFLSGSVLRIHFFASRLKFSRFVQISVVESQKVEPLVRSLVRHFQGFGGVPLMAVFDRPKTVAISWRANGKVTEWNSTFAQVTLAVGVGVELCWPYSGNQKGSVENLVGYVKNGFFKQRQFADMADLQQQLEAWQHEVNHVVACRATKQIPAERLALERPRLRPLKVQPEELTLRFPIQVGPTGRVLFEGATYSVDPGAIGIAGTLYLHEKNVRICAGRFATEHPRVPAGQASINPMHSADMAARVSGKRAKNYFKRERVLELGGAAQDFLTELVHRRPRNWMADVDKLFELLTQHGTGSVATAINLACAQQQYGAEYVHHHLRETLSRSQKDLFQ